jgi:hypothetical protein
MSEASVDTNNPQLFKDESCEGIFLSNALRFPECI